VDPEHGAATLYRVYRSGDATGGFVEDGLSTETWHVKPNEALGGGETAFFVVTSENGGGESGEAP
jgi:hypothetical protein